MRCSVFIATSLDGHIARPDGSLDWLPGADPDAWADDVDTSADVRAEDDDGGYEAFIATVDVLLLGRASYDAVRGFGIGWPYDVPVRVLTHRPLTDVGDGEDVSGIRGDVDEVLALLAAEGFGHVYVDGGEVVQQFLAADRIDAMTITTVPVLLGAGRPLFGVLPSDLRFTVTSVQLVGDGMVETRLLRDRS